jgi:hypothetical protein
VGRAPRPAREDAAGPRGRAMGRDGRAAQDGRGKRGGPTESWAAG